MLTTRQQSIYDFILDYRRRNGCTPSIPEIQREFGIRSPNGVAGHLLALQAKGLIRRAKRGSRKIDVTGPVDSQKSTVHSGPRGDPPCRLESMSELAELLERFRRGAELIAVAITGAAGAELDYLPAAGRWSIRQILCHLADSEIVGADRFRRIIAEENPTIVGYDQEAWARNLDYNRRKISQALETFRRTRAENYELLKPLPPATWERIGTHSEHGKITLLDLLRIYAEHPEGHSLQLREIREQYKVFKAKS